MAIDYITSHFLLKARTLGVRFKNTLTLGRLNLYASAKELPLAFQSSADIYADKFLNALGNFNSAVESLDVSNYEGACIVHDLNLPLPLWMGVERFDTIIDGGTLEHVYDVQQAITNCNKLLSIGGHFIGISPANNYCGHGFYQFSPEFWFSTFCEKNGYKIRYMELVEYSPIVKRHIIKDPAEVGRRVELKNRYPTLCLFVAVKNQPRRMVYSQQSDYINTWKEGPTTNSLQKLRKIILSTMPNTARMAERFMERFNRL